MKPRIALLGLVVYLGGCSSSHQPAAPAPGTPETPTLPTPPSSPSAAPSAAAVAEVAGQGATARDHVAFVAQHIAVKGEQKDPACPLTIPRIYTPVDGQVLSGTIELTASVVESTYCVNSARTDVQIFTEQGQLVRSVRYLDLGDRYRWDTRSVPNGRYGFTAEQSCCHVPSIPIYVTVQN